MRASIGAVAVLGTVLMLGASACDGDEASLSATATRTVGPTASSPSPTEEAFRGGREPVEATLSTIFQPALSLKDVRVAKQRGFDRITLEFTNGNGVPGYKVEYVQPPIIADASGMTVQVDGSAFIQIRLQPAYGYEPETGEQTYTGPSDLKPGLPSITEAVATGDFEGVLHWVLGVSEEVDFRVMTLESPPRLVVDVGHP